MTGKYTPGPWRIGNLESYDMEGTPFRRVYFNMKSDDIAEAHIRGDCCDANAHLISAAPDLLEALSDMVVVAKEAGWAEAMTGRQLILKNAIAAIAKAERHA